MTTYISYEIETLQPLKMGGTGSQSDNEAALDYIAGSTLRGAFIGAYLRQHSGLQLHEQQHERRRWLEGGIRFLNGYPVVNKRRALPFPACLYAPKEAYRLRSENSRLTEVVNELEGSVGAGLKRLPPNGFATWNHNGRLGWMNTRMTAKLHINLQEEKTKLYRYEAIAENQTFIGVVILDECTEQLRAFFLSFENQIMYLGGSKSNGYGKCRIKQIVFNTENPEAYGDVASIANTASTRGTFDVYCLSDMIIRDPFGRLSSGIPEQALSENLGVSVKLVASSVQTVITSGFNHKWGSRIPKQQAIQKGSVFRYSCEGELDFSLVQKLQHQGLGERRSDGFGRIVLLPELKVSEIVQARSESSASEEELRQLISPEERATLEQLLKRIAKQRIRKKLDERIWEWSKATSDHALSASMLASWSDLIKQLALQAPSEGKKKLRLFVEGLERRDKGNQPGGEKIERLNQQVLQALRRAKINGQQWLQVICNYVDKSDDISHLLCSPDFSLPEISGMDMRALLTNEDVYRLNMDMLDCYLGERCRLRNRHNAGEESVQA